MRLKLGGRLQHDNSCKNYGLVEITKVQKSCESSETREDCVNLEERVDVQHVVVLWMQSGILGRGRGRRLGELVNIIGAV
jgi:hypothetical protein